MIISEELIRELQRRVDVSYEEAERYLKKAKGDINLAVYRIKRKDTSLWSKIKKHLSDLLKYRFIMTRREKLLIDLPIWIVFVLIFIAKGNGYFRLFWLFIVFVIALIAECEVKVIKVDNEEIPKEILKIMQQQILQ